ncbi:MAG: hypothetical protein IJI61_07860 [Oscillospiraceae bacterium]|nr:hypothetical protein [Oscillospiraceae bacterium]
MGKDSKSLEVSCYVLGAGAFGVFFRWMQLQLAYDKGLPDKSVWHFFVVLLVCAGAGVFQYFTRKQAKEKLAVPEDFFEALQNEGKLYAVIRWAIALVMIAGGVLLFSQSEVDADATFLRVLAVLGILTGIAFPLTLVCANKPHVVKNSTITLLALIPILFFACGLLTAYKQNSINPIMWNYLIEILTLIVDAVAFFRLAGFAYGVPDGKKTMFYCMWGAMLSLMTLADSRYLGQQIMFFAVALMLTLANWILIANLQKREIAEDAADQEETKKEAEPVERL